MTKVIVIGLNHAGCAAARALLNLDDFEVSLYERNKDISFLTCGMALWIGGQLSTGKGLFYATVEAFEELGARVRVESSVESVDFTNKIISGRTKDGKSFTESYDKLVLATGSRPRSVNVIGSDLPNIISAKTYLDAERAVQMLLRPDIKRVIVIGGGYIGAELAEACCRRGKSVGVVDIAPRIFYTHTDEKFSALIEERLLEHGVEFHLGERVLSFEGDSRVRAVRTTKGEYPADLVITCAGFEPVTDLGAGKLTLGARGAFAVNRYQETSQPDVYAVGDCATVFDNSIGDYNYIALSGHAIRSGIIAAHNIAGIRLASIGMQGASGQCIYGMRLLTVGMSVQAAQARGIDVSYVDVVEKQYSPYVVKENNPDVHLRLVYRNKDRVLIGAQMASTYDMSGGIHMYSLAIQRGLTVDKLALLDIYYSAQLNGSNYYSKAAIRALKDSVKGM